MDAIATVFANTLPRALGTVLHIGAGAQALDLYAGLDVERLVLVEGDPDTRAELEAQARLSARQVQVRGDVVMPQAGPVLWHRYSLRTLNGPLAAEGLTTVYPRLRLWSTLPLQATAFAELLVEVAETDAGQRPNLLVLDVSGQEAGLLRDLPAALLQRFAWVVCRGSEAVHGTGWEDGRQSTKQLLAAHFQLQSPSAAVSDPLWPVQAFRFDPQGFALSEARRGAETLRAELAETGRQRDLLVKAAEESQATIDGLKAEKALVEAAMQAQAQKHMAQLAQERDEQAARFDLQLAALSEAQRSVETLHAELAETGRQRDLLVKAAQESQATIDGLKAEKALAEAAMQDQAQKHMAQLAQERDEQAARFDLQLAALSEAQRSVETLHAELAETGRQRDLLVKAAQESEATIDGLKAEKALAEAAMQDQAQKHLAQLAQERDEQAVHFNVQRSALSQAELAMEKLRAELAAICVEREALEKSAHESQAAIERLKAEKAAVEASMLDQSQKLSELRTAAAAQSQAQAQLEVRLRELEAALIASQTARTESENKSAWRADQMKQLAQERDEQAALLKTTAARLAEAQAAVADLKNQLNAAGTGVARAEAAARDTTARLEDEIAQLRLRQRLMDEEMIKAEGQIELIKDVLLREPSL
jgi:hypothetical protein